MKTMRILALILICVLFPILAFSQGSLGDAINVKESPYNAIGDGVTDDYSAINRAMSAAISAGVPLYFPKGTYVIGTRLVPPSGKISIVGDGMGASTIKAGTNISGVGPGNALLTISGPGANGSILRDFTLDGNKAGQTTSRYGLGILISSADGVTLQRVGVINCIWLGVGLRDSQGTSLLDCSLIDACHSNLWMSADSHDITAGRPSRTLIRGNFISGSGVEISGRDVLMDGNYLTNGGVYEGGIYVTEGARIVTISNNISRQAGQGVDVNVGNSITGKLYTGDDASEGVLITGNNVSDCYGPGINTGSNGTVITGNVCLDDGAYGAGRLLAIPHPWVGSSGGSGYNQYDILALVGGTGTPARVMVKSVRGGVVSRLVLVDPGDYTTFPAMASGGVDTINSTGSGSGCKVKIGGIKVNPGHLGSGYRVGDILRLANGSGRRAKVQVTSTGAGGSITGISIYDAGGYATAPGVSTATGGSGTGAIFDTMVVETANTPTDQTCGISIGGAANCIVSGNVIGNSSPSTTGTNGSEAIGLRLWAYGKPTSSPLYPNTGNPDNTVITGNSFYGLTNSPVGTGTFSGGNPPLPLIGTGHVITGNRGFNLTDPPTPARRLSRKQR
jgi:hypothetical protein